MQTALTHAVDWLVYHPRTARMILIASYLVVAAMEQPR